MSKWAATKILVLLRLFLGSSWVQARHRINLYKHMRVFITTLTSCANMCAYRGQVSWTLRQPRVLPEAARVTWTPVGCVVYEARAHPPPQRAPVYSSDCKAHFSYWTSNLDDNQVHTGFISTVPVQKPILAVTPSTLKNLLACAPPA